MQKEAGRFEHDLHNEVVLLHGVFDIFRREQGGADRVFVEQRAWRAANQFAGERAFAGSRQTGHQNNHSVELVADSAAAGSSAGGCGKIVWVWRQSL